MTPIHSVTLRVLSLPAYRVPLYAHVMDSDYGAAEVSLETITREIGNASATQVITEQKWSLISEIATAVLQDDRLWQSLSPQNPTMRIDRNSSWRVYRHKLISQLRSTQETPSKLAFDAISNSLYQSSEGITLPIDYIIAPSSLTWFNETLSAQVIRYIEHRKLKDPSLRHLERDDVIAWLRLLFLVQNNPTQRFKEQFKRLLIYEIPFGLSPESRSSTLEYLLANSKTIALVPMLTGINTVSTALATGEWLVALKAATTTGAVVIVLLSSIAITDRIVSWAKSRH